MGNNTTKEARGADSLSSPGYRQPEPEAGAGSGSSLPNTSTDRNPINLYPSRPGRGSRPDLSFLGIGSNSNHETPERRETKQEREARKLEKERQARIKERERSLKEEHIDGGYLVTMGVYTGPEDFSKPVVRQLMIERRMAPFWRGLNDYSESWAEHQLIAAGRGLPIPAADEIPSTGLASNVSPDSPNSSNQNLQSLMVPIASRSHSTASDASTYLSPSHPAFSNSSYSPPASPVATSSSPFRPRSKTLASLTNASKNPSSSDIVPREIQLPKDPFVNGQAIEVFLYKDATECPICFLSYPPYLNKTRCCDQPICSECFVQIKRPDPHPPEHHDSSSPSPADIAADAEALVSEPACCPYCQQPEFGVTYDPPPFRRGLSYANHMPGLAGFASAMSSSSSINSTTTPIGTPSAPNTHKRRTVSISANASTVITTDRVRPDWATKLANARSHLARRSAAATALHTAAYLMNGSQEARGFGFRSSRLVRHRAESASGAATPSSAVNETGERSVSEQINSLRREAAVTGDPRRRGRIEDLEEMMMMEAIRQSLAAEEERKRKAEKEAAKEAKKKAKEDKKREKREKKGVYGSGASSATASTMSLNLPGIGRRRGNSGASMLREEVTPDTAEPSDSKGKAIDRGTTSTSSGSAPISFQRAGNSQIDHSIPGARYLDATTLAAVNEIGQSASSPTAPDRPSHLRQMSNASSPASSFMESIPGSLKNDVHGSTSSLDSPRGSRTQLEGQYSGTPNGDDSNGGVGLDSMFNFQSLAAMIGQEDEASAKDAAKHIEHLENGQSHNRESSSIKSLGESVVTLKIENNANTQTTLLNPYSSTPGVMVTPETPAALDSNLEEGKQLGTNWTSDIAPRKITQ